MLMYTDRNRMTIPRAIGGEELEVDLFTRPNNIACPHCGSEVGYDHQMEGRHAAEVLYHNVSGTWLWELHMRLEELYKNGGAKEDD